MSGLLLSVVIPTCHRNDLLALCLDRLAPGQQTLPRDQYEVIVTDDGSRSTAEPMIAERFPWCRWVQGPRRGPAANRNCGAGAGTAEWIVFCDDDCLPGPVFLQSYLNAIIAHPDSRVFEGRTSAEGPRRHPLQSAPINETGGFLWSCNFAIHRETFRKIGGFNEAFPFAAMEDMDFRKRLVGFGFDSRFVPQAEIVHPWRMLDLRSHARKHTTSQLIYARLHPEDRHLFTFWQHCKNTARYYLRDFPGEFREFGWLSVRSQPARWWEFFYRAGRLLARRPRS